MYNQLVAIMLGGTMITVAIATLALMTSYTYVVNLVLNEN